MRENIKRKINKFSLQNQQTDNHKIRKKKRNPCERRKNKQTNKRTKSSETVMNNCGKSDKKSTRVTNELI